MGVLKYMVNPVMMIPVEYAISEELNLVSAIQGVLWFSNFHF